MCVCGYGFVCVSGYGRICVCERREKEKMKKIVDLLSFHTIQLDFDIQKNSQMGRETHADTDRQIHRQTLTETDDMTMAPLEDQS